MKLGEELLNGEPSAFASMISMGDGGIYVQSGLTKREYFASAALSGLLANPNVRIDDISSVALMAMKASDALIFELSVQETVITMKNKVHDHKYDAVPSDADGSLNWEINPKGEHWLYEEFKKQEKSMKWEETALGDRFYEWSGRGLRAVVCHSFFSGKWSVHLWRKVGENAYDWVKIPLAGVTSYDSLVDAEAAALVFGEKALKGLVV